MKCVVTGGLGFIGAHLVERLRGLGHEPYVIDDGSNPSVDFKRKSNSDAYPLYDLLYLRKLPPDIDCVFHLAAVSRTLAAFQHPTRCMVVNVAGSVNLLSLVSECCPRARVVLASSNIVYGPPSVYRCSKLAMEEYAQACSDCYGINCVSLRYSNVYGPRMRWDDSLCLAAMRRSAVERGYIEISGDGSQSRDWTHVTDVVEATINAAFAEYRGTLDVTSAHHRTVLHMAGLVRQALNKSIDFRFTEPRPADAQKIYQGFATWSILKWFGEKITPEQGIFDILDRTANEAGVLVQ